jgi:hypothetical protein
VLHCYQLGTYAAASKTIMMHYVRHVIYIIYGNIRGHNIFILLGMATLGTDHAIIQIFYKCLRLAILSFYCPYVEVIVVGSYG